MKSIPPPTAAEESFERTLFPLILRSKISGNSVLSEYYLVASAAEGPVRQPLRNERQGTPEALSLGRRQAIQAGP